MPDQSPPSRAAAIDRDPERVLPADSWRHRALIDAVLVVGIGLCVLVGMIVLLGMSGRPEAARPVVRGAMDGSGILVIVCSALVVLLGGAWFTSRRLRDLGAMEERNHRLGEALMEAAEAERTRLGQNLHDDLGQHLTALGMLSASLGDRLGGVSPALAEDADRIVRLAEEAGHRVRALSRVCLIDWTQRAGLVRSLEILCASASELFGVGIVARIDERFNEADEGMAPNIVRIVSEAINNAVRHSEPDTITVSLRMLRHEGSTHAARAELRIEDSPKRPVAHQGSSRAARAHSPNEAGLGIAIMRARARALDGELEVIDQPNAGLVIRCVFAPRWGEGSRRIDAHGDPEASHAASPLWYKDAAIPMPTGGAAPHAGGTAIGGTDPSCDTSTPPD